MRGFLFVSSYRAVACSLFCQITQPARLEVVRQAALNKLSRISSFPWVHSGQQPAASSFPKASFISRIWLLFFRIRFEFQPFSDIIIEGSLLFFHEMAVREILVGRGEIFLVLDFICSGQFCVFLVVIVCLSVLVGEFRIRGDFIRRGILGSRSLGAPKPARWWQSASPR
jgi:hypothetical protein